MIFRSVTLSKCLLFLLCVGGLSVSGLAAAKVNCEMDNAALQEMTPSTVRFVRVDGSVFEIDVRTASNNKTRAQGFQRVCREAIAAKPILFIFDQEVMPRFHMNNVVAGIDIAFIKKDGAIESIQAMMPYTLVSKERPLYGPKEPILVALEAHPGFYKKHKLVGSRVSWAPVSTTP